MSPIVALVLAISAALVAGPASAQPASPAPSARDAVERAVPLLQEAAVTFVKSSGCVSCHHNTLTVITLAMARGQNVRVDEDLAFAQQELTTEYIKRWRDGKGDAPDDPATLSNLLLALSIDGYPQDDATARMAAALSRQQAQTGEWRPAPQRFDGNSEEIAATAAAIRAMQVYGTKDEQASYESIGNRAAAWLQKVQPDNTEGLAFRLLGLYWAHAPADRLEAAAGALVDTQRPDGGWAQTANGSSDAMATGQALFALAETQSIAPDDPVFQRGAAFLLARQLDDGSWFVRSRAKTFMPYVDTGFPHGTDQFASITATNWAAMALALSR